MTGDHELAAAVTAGLLAVDGVRAVFPEHPVAAAVLSIVLPDAEGAAALVEVERAETALRITARLSTDRTAGARTVLALVTAVVEELLHGQEWSIEVELAHIE